MTNSKSTKRALLLSALSLLVCVSMLIGSTFAWFTDSVTSAGNIIKSGTLDVTMEWFDGTKAVPAADSADWIDASTGAIFESTLWEPGYAVVRHIKIANEGTLALKYQLNILANGEVSKLADVIDVYYVDPAVQVTDRTNLDEGNKLGTLSEVLEQINTTASGNLKAGENHTITLALKMQETAGNEYQNLSIGADFSVQLLATQLTSEYDSFDNQYDADASMIDVILAHGGTINLGENTDKEMVVSKDADVEINLNSNTLSNTLTNNGEVEVNGGTIEVADAGLDNFGTATLTGVTMNAGSTADYSNRTSGADAETTYNDVTIDSAGGGIGVADGATVTFNSGSLAVNSASTSGRYLFYVVGEGSVANINNGEFSFSKTLNQKRAYIYAGEGATVYVKGGTFGKASTRSGYTAGILGDGNVIITGGTFGFDPTTWVADGYKATKVGDVYYVTADNIAVANTADTLIEALEKGEDVLLLNNVKIDPANMSNAYGTTGINVKNGQTIDGNGNTLDIKGAGGTWDSGINTTGGLIKNLTVTGSFRGIFINHNSTHSEQVVLENVVIDGTVYTISCDQGTNQTLKATKSTFKGWTSYAATLGSAEFVNCYFGEGSGYAYCRPYAPTTFVGCDFEAGFEMDARAAVTFENCTIGGVALTADNLATLVTSNVANASVK